jgi:hypothetical protein
MEAVSEGTTGATVEETMDAATVEGTTRAMGGTMDAVSATVFCRRVRGAMLVWQVIAGGTTQWRASTWEDGFEMRDWG